MRLCDSIKDIQRQRLGAAVEHNDVILTLGLHTTSRIGHTPKGQLISECLFDAIVSTKKPTKFF